MTFFSDLTNLLLNGMGSNLFHQSGNLIAGIAPIFQIGFGIYILLVAFNYYNKGVDGSIIDLTKSSIGWLIVIACARISPVVRSRASPCSVEAQNDPRFHRKTLINKIDHPPFYATAKTVTVHHTLGGVEINERTQVLNSQKQPIPHLFAAGEVTGGIHGANRLGGNSFPDCIVFGRIAGTEAARN